MPISLGGFIGIGAGGYNPVFYNRGWNYRPNIYVQPGIAVIGSSYPRYDYGPWGRYYGGNGYGYNNYGHRRHHHRRHWW